MSSTPDPPGWCKAVCQKGPKSDTWTRGQGKATSQTITAARNKNDTNVMNSVSHSKHHVLVPVPRDGDSATFLGSLFQCLITLSVKKFRFRRNLSWHNFRLFPLVLSFVTWEKRLTPTSLQPPFSIFDTSQDAIGFLGHLGTLLAHIQAAVNQHPQVLFCLAAFQPLFPKPVALHGVVVTQVQDLALSLVEPHAVGLGPSIQPVQVPLQSLPTLQQINTPTQLGVICKLTEGALDPVVQIIDKDIKQNWPQHRALGNTACDWPPTGVNSIHHHSLGPAIQPVLYPAKSPPVQAMSSQFLQENAVGNHVNGFTKLWVDNIHSLSLIY
ncbi:hypothetical protein QYF61_009631 [Mycteria americana]|uniref:Uncharacterized protein n=1 Tax=Mycteria americana TaxID=33587 RepID=A0AAN7NDS4_MYCAM|nr:hypothetical protein QYF61_009631 [Mycteria americana]